MVVTGFAQFDERPESGSIANVVRLKVQFTGLTDFSLKRTYFCVRKNKQKV